jgi:glutamyl-Q tRNA(Asp) synthetase
LVSAHGAADDILRTLENFGFEWNGNVIYQSQRQSLYSEALDTLKNQNFLYPCTCTRKEIADSSHTHGIDGVIYPRNCLIQPIKPNAPIAWRVKTDSNPIVFEDAIQGSIEQILNRDIGDFILKRADGLFAYQLAVVVDDAAQNITHIVRGADLLDSTPRQIYLQKLLDLNSPHYAHVPVVTNSQGEKLSKQTLAKPVEKNTANLSLFDALKFLGQQPPVEIRSASLSELWQWALANWQLENIPKLRNNFLSPAK